MAYLSVKRITGQPTILKYLCTNEDATEFSQGDLVKLDASGTLVVATSGNILGIAQSDNPADDDVYVDVDIITPNGDLFEMVCSGTAATTDLGEIQTVTFTAGAHTIADGSNDFIPLKVVTSGSGGIEQGMFKYSSLQAVTGF